MLSKHFKIILLTCTFLLIHNLFANEGTLIAFLGIGGAGKSTLAELVAQKTNCMLFLEKDGSEVPELYHLQNPNKPPYSAEDMMIFRHIWLADLLKADNVRKDGKVAIVDSLYIKTLARELEQEGAETMFDMQDPYFEQLKTIAQLDLDRVPNPDCIVLVHASPDDYHKMLKARSRHGEDVEALYNTYETATKAFATIAQELSENYNIKLIEFKNTFGSPEEEADKLIKILHETNILSAHFDPLSS